MRGDAARVVLHGLNGTYETNLRHVPRLRFGLVWVAMLVSGMVSGQETAEQKPPLPLKRVVLFSSSVGFFEHGGQIEGNQTIEFAFKSSDINDLLKSLVVQDRDGGLVTSVNYGSPAPVAQTLTSLAVDLTETPTLAQIFQQLRGQAVRVETPATVSGVIVGVETRRVLLADKEMCDVDVLNLRTAEGLQSVRIESIVRTHFLDPRTEREFQQALEILGTARRNDQKRVKLEFRGAGQRKVSVGYIQEAPVWKTSYRLVLADGERPFLQGWAIVENTSAQDWQDVQLTLVSGRPISFLMDLYEPLYLSRPLVMPEQHAALRPRVYDQDLAGNEKEFQQAASMAGRAKRGGGGFGGMGGGMGGMGGGAMGGMGVGGGYAPADPFAEPGVSGRARPPLVVNGVPDGASSSIDLSQGVASNATAGDVGELFRYVINAPVTLKRNESAMLPIVNDRVTGEKVAIYNPAVHAKHPLSGLRLTNTTPLHLLQGPITLFDGGEYAGDAIEDIPPGSTRLISYALDLETEVAVEAKPAEQVTVALAIRKGGLHVKHKVSRQAEYLVKNSSDRAKQVMIERPIEHGWTLLQPLATETTRAVQRFAVAAEPGMPAKLLIVDERDLVEDSVLATLVPSQLELFLRMQAASPDLKKAMQEVLDRKTAAAEIRASRAALEAVIAGLGEDQDRVRRNLQSVPKVGTDDPAAEENRKASRELLQRYLTKLADLETALEKQRVRLEGLKQEETRAERQLDVFLQELVVE